MNKDTSKNNNLLYSIFSAIGVVLCISLICVLILYCGYICEEIKNSSKYGIISIIKDEKYSQKYIDYTVDVKELNENESLVEVYIENKGRELVSFDNNALSIYKYDNINSNVYKTNKVAQIDLLDDNNEMLWFELDGISHAKIQFKVPKELTTEEYKIDFDTVVTIQEPLYSYEEYYVSTYTETEAKINNNVKN